VKIYLLLINDEEFFFYSDESEAAHDREEAHESGGKAGIGLLDWLGLKLTKFKTAWHETQSGVTFWLRRLWDWLHSWSHPDEWMLSRLRTAGLIELHHPASRSEEEVAAIWQKYIAQQTTRHAVWLAVNGVVAPFSIVFAILPGPNVIGYWFLYRAIHHLLVVWGTIRVRRGAVPITLHSRDALDVPVRRDDEGKTSHRALAGAGERLAEHVARSQATKRGPGPG
jgi:hypothetical protein